MKKLIFAVVMVLGSLVVLSACSEDSVLADLENTKEEEGGGSSSSDPIYE